jgi:hypothetical protein
MQIDVEFAKLPNRSQVTGINTGMKYETRSRWPDRNLARDYRSEVRGWAMISHNHVRL